MHVDMTSWYILCIWSFQTTTEPTADIRRTKIPNMQNKLSSSQTTTNNQNKPQKSYNSEIHTDPSLLHWSCFPSWSQFEYFKHPRLLSDNSSKPMHILRQTGSVVQFQRENNLYGQPVMLPMSFEARLKELIRVEAPVPAAADWGRWKAWNGWPFWSPGGPSTSESSHCGRVISRLPRGSVQSPM